MNKKKPGFSERSRRLAPLHLQKPGFGVQGIHRTEARLLSVERRTGSEALEKPGFGAHHFVFGPDECGKLIRL